MRTICLILLVFIFWSSTAQTDSVLNYSNQVKLSPVRLITGIRGIQVSYERSYKRVHSTQLTVAYLIDLLPPMYKYIDNLSGYSFGIEQKYFIRKKKHKSFYTSVDCSYLNSSFVIHDGFAYKDPADLIPKFYNDTVTVLRQTFTFSLKAGIQYRYKRFICEFSAGAGIRYRDVKHKGKLFSDGYLYPPIELTAPHELFKEGRYFTFNIPLGFKIGYAF